MTARAATEARIAALPRCRHGRTYGGGPASLASVECRVCLDDGNDVANFLEAYPGGGDLRDVAEALGCSYQAVQQAEVRALRKLRAALVPAGDGEAPRSAEQGEGAGSTRRRGARPVAGR